MNANKFQRLWKVALNGSLLVALAFVFVWKLTPTENHVNRALAESRHTSLNAFVSHGTGVFYRTPVSPREAGPSLETIVKSEDDSQMGGIGFACPATYLVFASHDLLSDHILSALPALFFRNRPTVPLFVLHHSWKNFL